MPDRIRRGLIGDGEVFDGPYGPRRISYADYTTSGRSLDFVEDHDGHIDLDHLRRELDRYAQRPLRIGSFSAASNVTGVLTDTDRTAAPRTQRTVLLGLRGRRTLRADQDAPEPPGRRQPQGRHLPVPTQVRRRPGVLVVRRELVRNTVPTAPGGGTPAIVVSIRAGLVFAVKDAVGTDLIQARERRLWHEAMTRWARHPNIQVLGNPTADRLSVVSFHAGEEYLHHNVVVAVLIDLFGIQSRGGCSCAGPYFITDTVRDYLIDAVELVADHGHRLLPDHLFDPHTGLWHHQATPAAPAGLDDEFEALRWFVLPPDCLTRG